MTKIIEDARIVNQERVVGQIFRLRLHSPPIAGAASPGQFVMLRVREGTDPLLRRPLSFSRIHADRGEFEILYRVAGRGTWLLSQAAPGQTLSIIGPLGNGFRLASSPTSAAFIAGGIGIAPLMELMVRISSEGDKPRDARLFYGARTASELLPESELESFGIPVHFATDDGTLGEKGRITTLFENYTASENFRPSEIYSCGPLAMQYHVAGWALKNGAASQLSMESLMACGMGACLGCALPANVPGDPESDRYVHVCEDGPIFSAGSIKWNKILAQQTPPPTLLFS